jgi:hypothetical protein
MISSLVDLARRSLRWRWHLHSSRRLRPGASRHVDALLALTVAGLLGGATGAAQAVPSYARQTGMDCTGCHVGAFGPQLTPAGMMFKLTGYTDTDGKAGKIPLSGMIVGSWTHTAKPQDPPPDHLRANNNTALDEASLFVAGRFSDHIGAFVQITYDGVGHTVALDQTDIRYAGITQLFGRETVVGVTLNNNPGVQDPFNSTPVWSYPYIESPAGFGTGDAATLVNGGLEGIVVGASAYALWDKTVYAELGSYRSMSPSLQSNLGLGRDPQRLRGNAYGRLAWTQDLKSQAWHVGVLGWSARLQPDRDAGGPADNYRDLGLEGGYQYLGTRRHIFTANASLIRELKTEGGSGLRSNLTESRLNGSYNFAQTWGVSSGWFATRGSDPTAATRGALWQVDWTPWGKEDIAAPAPFGWANLRLGAQFWRYSRFAGETAGASDHNTFSLFAWSSF